MRQHPPLTLAQFEHKAWTIRDAHRLTFRDSSDGDGFLWLGTSRGCIASTVCASNSSPDRRGSRFLDDVSTLLALPDGTLWIGYRFGGRACCGIASRLWRARGLPGGTVERSARDSTGVIWAAASRGLARLEGRQ